jgi:hypothetical protein
MVTVPKFSRMGLWTLYGKITGGHIALSSAIWQKYATLGMFAEMRKTPIGYLILIWQHVSVRLPLARFLWNLGVFVNTCLENRELLKIWQKYRVISMET